MNRKYIWLIIFLIALLVFAIVEVVSLRNTLDALPTVNLTATAAWYESMMESVRMTAEALP